MLLYPLLLLLLLVFPAAASASDDDLAVVISIRRYDHTHEVKFAHRDGASMKDALVRALGFRPERVVERPDAGYVELRSLFGTAEQPGEIAGHLQSRKAKRLWVYFSGHGVPGPGPTAGTYERYLMPRDGRPASLRFSALRLAEVQAVLNVIRERHMAPEATVVLVLEACFSGRSEAGEIVPESSVGPFRVPPSSAGGLLILSATGTDELASWDRNAEQGLFTDIVIDTLFGRAGRDDRGRVTLAHLEAHAQSQIPRRLSSLFPGQGRTQRPSLVGRSESILASFTGEPPARDPIGAAAAERDCNAYLHIQKEDVVEKFLDDCRACSAACRERLGKYLSTLRTERHRCEGEMKSVEGLIRLGDVARQALIAMAKDLTCTNAQTLARERLAGTDAAEKAAREKAAADEKARDKAKQQAEAAPEEKQRLGLELTRTIQQELARVGCDPGVQDGKWGPNTRRMAREFVRHAKLEKLELATDEPSEKFRDALTRRRDRACPLGCGDGEVAVGDECRPVQRRKIESQKNDPKSERTEKTSRPRVREAEDHRRRAKTETSKGSVVPEATAQPAARPDGRCAQWRTCAGLWNISEVTRCGPRPPGC